MTNPTMSRRQLTPARAAQVKGYVLVSANGQPIDDTMSVEDTVKLFGVRPNNFINLCRCSTGWSMRRASRDHEKPHGITWAARQFPQAHAVACVAGQHHSVTAAALPCAQSLSLHDV